MTTLKCNQLFWFVVVGVLVLWHCQGDAQATRNRNARRRQNRNPLRRGGLDPMIHAAYMNAINDDVTTTPSPDDQSQQGQNNWMLYTPSLPGPGEIECYFDVITAERHGGVCLRLGAGNHTYACQSGPHLRIQRNCQRTMLEREARARASDSRK